MDQAAIDAAGLQPIACRPVAHRRGDVEGRICCASWEALRRDGLNTLFTLAVGADLKDSNATLMGVDQGGTSLPDRDYYVKDDAKNRETREQYVAHVTRMLALAGADDDVAASNAEDRAGARDEAGGGAARSRRAVATRRTATTR